MINFEFNPLSSYDHHECKAIRDGDWLIYRCPKCSDYERRYNWRTRQMKTYGLKADVHHFGIYDMKEYKELFINRN